MFIGNIEAMAGNDITMNWSKFIKGTTENTIFDGKDWVGKLASFNDEEEAAAYFNKLFSGRWSISGGNLPSITELVAASWAERYAMVCLFKPFGHPYIKIFIDKKTLGSFGTDYYSYYRYELRDKWLEFKCDLTPGGNIAVITGFAPAHSDSDPDYVFRIYSPNGEALTEWRHSSGSYSSSGYETLKRQY